MNMQMLMQTLCNVAACVPCIFIEKKEKLHLNHDTISYLSLHYDTNNTTTTTTTSTTNNVQLYIVMYNCTLACSWRCVG